MDAHTHTIIRDLADGDADWIVRRHAALYAESDGFDQSFGALVAEIVQTFARERAPITDRAFILAQGQTRLGCVFCVALDTRTAKLRLFLVEPHLRGQGQGQRLLDAFLDHARACGFERVRLWTHESHRAACALYARNGFTLMSSKPVTSFGVPLVEQQWEKDLTGHVPAPPARAAIG